MAFATAASTSTGEVASDGGSDVSNVVIQKSGVCRVENQRAEPVLGLRDRLLADDHVLLVRGHFGFRLHDVDGRHRADLDALAVVAEGLQRQFQRRPLHRRGPTAPRRDPNTRS